jgi:hypothetical protein
MYLHVEAIGSYKYLHVEAIGSYMYVGHMLARRVRTLRSRSQRYGIAPHTKLPQFTLHVLFMHNTMYFCSVVHYFDITQYSTAYMYLYKLIVDNSYYYIYKQRFVVQNALVADLGCFATLWAESHLSERIVCINTRPYPPI